jgi:hypothetical protein
VRREGVGTGGLAITTWSRARLWLSSSTFDKAVSRSKAAALLLLPPPPPGGATVDVAQPSRPGLRGQAPKAGAAHILLKHSN